jgi:hypothetical protein
MSTEQSATHGHHDEEFIFLAGEAVRAIGIVEVAGDFVTSSGFGHLSDVLRIETERHSFASLGEDLDVVGVGPIDGSTFQGMANGRQSDLRGRDSKCGDVFVKSLDSGGCDDRADEVPR